MTDTSISAARSTVRTSRFGSTAHAFLLTLASNVRRVAKAQFNRRLAKRLEEYSDKELADIGLTRDDVRYGLAIPYHSDPTIELARRARLNSYY